MPVSRNSFDDTKWYYKVLFQETNALLDFDFNEAQDILRTRLDHITAAFADGVALFGTSGLVVPSATARAVDVTGGILLSGGQVVRVPTTAALAAFNVGATGVQSAVVYVDWNDTEVTGVMDNGFLDPTYGPDNTHRIKRNVAVLTAAGSSLPAPASGHTLIWLATVTHDFGGGTTILAGDVAMQPYGPSVGELAGYGAQRSLRITSGAPAASDGFVFDTRAAMTGVLARWRNAGADQLVLSATGQLGVGKIPAAGKALDVVGAGAFSLGLALGDNLTITAGKTVDGVTVGSHDHTGAVGHGVQVTHVNLLGLGSDDHAQYVHTTIARTVTAVHQFAPSAASAPFTIGANAQGQKVTGLNADLLDGIDSLSFAQLAAAQNITGAWQFKANVGLDAGKTVAGIDLNAARDTGTGIGHAKLSGLGGDDHAQYMHTAVARTVTAVHLFNPSAVSPPFTIGGNAAAQLVVGLNAERVGSQSLAQLDTRYLGQGGGTLTGVLALLSTLYFGSDTNVALWRTGNALNIGTVGGITLSGGVVADALTVTGASSVAGRLKATGNILDTTGAATVTAVSALASALVSAVGKRALVTYLHVTPDVAYTGTYTVQVYGDNNTSSELMAQWTTQSGDLLDRVPWYFINARTDEQLYVQITKNSQTTTAHNFTVSLRAERFA